MTYDSALAGNLISTLADARRAAARRRPATLWVKEIHRLDRKAQQALAADMANWKVWTSGRLRIISSSTADLFEYVRAGTFDAGLFYRLNNIHIVVPMSHGMSRALSRRTSGMTIA